MSAHAGWRQVVLGDVVSFPGGKARVPDGAGVRPTLTFKGLRATGVLDLDDSIPAEDAESKNMTALQPGDVVATAQGHATGWILKKVGHISGDTPLAYSASTLQVMRPRRDRLDDRFLLHYLSWPLTYRRVTDLAGPRRSFTAKMFGSIPITLPPIEEQRRIAAVLDAADELRAKRREALAKLDTLTQAIYIDMFGHPQGDRGWEMRSLASLGRVHTGKTPPGRKSGMYGDAVPFVTPGDLQSAKPTQRWLSHDGAANSRVVPPGSTLVCCIGATIGKVGQAAEESAFNQQINAIVWDREVVAPSFGTYTMRLLSPEVAQRGASTTLPLLKKSAFERLEIPVPPLPLQAQFTSAAGALAEQHRKGAAQAIRLDALLASLQQQAFRGEL